MNRIKKIAVISKNKELARLAELEAISLGVKAHIFKIIPSDLSEFDIVLLDADTSARSLPSGDFVLAGISSSEIEADKATGRFDYTLRYPFSLGELRSVFLGDKTTSCVRNNIQSNDAPVLYADFKARTIYLGETSLSLSDYEFRVLTRLCSTPKQPVSRAELSEILGAVGDGNMADVYVCHLRKKFEKISTQKIIYTVRAQGYKTNYSMKNISEQD